MKVIPTQWLKKKDACVGLKLQRRRRSCWAVRPIGLGTTKQAAAGSCVRAEVQGLLGAKVATVMDFQEILLEGKCQVKPSSMEDGTLWRSDLEIHSHYWQVGSEYLSDMVLFTIYILFLVFFPTCYYFICIWQRIAYRFVVLLLRTLPVPERGWVPMIVCRRGGSTSERYLEMNPEFLLWYICTVADGSRGRWAFESLSLSLSQHDSYSLGVLDSLQCWLVSCWAKHVSVWLTLGVGRDNLSLMGLTNRQRGCSRDWESCDAQPLWDY